MAKIYGEIAASAKMTFDKSFARANGQPLDSTEVFYSKTSAEEYAATDVAYVGQKIVVIEGGTVTHYGIEDASGTLKELGAATLGDNKSLVLGDDKVLSIRDFGKQYYAYTKTEEGYEYVLTQGFKEGLEPRVTMQVVDGVTAYVLAWYEPSLTTVEGLDTRVTNLEDRLSWDIAE